MIKLRTGELVNSLIVHAPAPDWAERIEGMLYHKGDPWNWQNNAILNKELAGVDAFFYILHRDGKPFANIMTVECGGVGIFGHVWTDPADRRKGASSELMKIQMEDFHQRNGQALYLSTGHSVAKRMYSQLGFEEIAPESGLMTYTTSSLSDFEENYFAFDDDISPSVQPVDWCHWPAACPLFMSGSPGVARHVGMGIVGKGTPEGPMLPLLRRAEEQPDAPPQMMVLALPNGALVGVASWTIHPLWRDKCIVDLYCHANFWSYGQQLLDSLQLPAAANYVAYGDLSCQAKNQILTNFGFTHAATLPQWLIGQGTESSSDLLLLTKQ